MKMYYIIGRYNPNIELFLEMIRYPVITVTFEEIQTQDSRVIDIYKEPYQQCLDIAREKCGKQPIEIITTFDNIIMAYNGESKGTMVSEELSFLPHDSIIPITSPVEQIFTALYSPPSMFDDSITNIINRVQNLMVIPSVLAVGQGRSVFTKEERLEQTLKQAESIQRVTGPKPTTVLVEMSRKEDLTSCDVRRLREAFDVVLLGYKDEVLMDYVHRKSDKSISEAYVFLAMLKVARSSGAETLIKFGGRYHFHHFPYHGILADSTPTIRFHHDIGQSELYSVPKKYYNTYEKHLKQLLTGVLENASIVMNIEKMLYHFALEVGCDSMPRLFVRGYNSKGAFKLV